MERKLEGPHLVVVPLSVLSSWMDEIKRWCAGANLDRPRPRAETVEAAPSMRDQGRTRIVSVRGGGVHTVDDRRGQTTLAPRG